MSLQKFERILVKIFKPIDRFFFKPPIPPKHIEVKEVKVKKEYPPFAVQEATYWLAVSMNTTQLQNLLPFHNLR